MIFLLIDYFILGTRQYFWQHFCLFNIAVLFAMYVEASRRNALAPAIAEAQLNALTARIRPHFLFNSLNAAISLIRLRPYDAETLLENLANLFRAQLQGEEEESTLRQEIEWAQEYISIEQIRMGQTRIQVMWQHKAPDDAATPHLLLQPLLENAIFHGVETTHRPGYISVMTAKKGHWIYLRIDNPIPNEADMAEHPTKVHKSNSMALKNIQERLALMFDSDAKMKIGPVDADTYRVDIRFPYRKKNN